MSEDFLDLTDGVGGDDGLDHAMDGSEPVESLGLADLSGFEATTATILRAGFTPDERVAYAYLAGAMTDEGMTQVEQRLDDDPAFASLLLPLLSQFGNAGARAAAHAATTPSESFDAYLHRTGQASVVTRPKRFSWWKNRRTLVTLIVVLSALASLGTSAWEYFRPVPRPEPMQIVSGGPEGRLKRLSSSQWLALGPNAQVTYRTPARPSDGYEFVLLGQSQFTLTRPGRWAHAVQTGLATIESSGAATVTVTATPDSTRVVVFHGNVRVTSRAHADDPVTAVAGDTILVAGSAAPTRRMHQP